jgi:cyanophycin synthetase
VTQGNAVPVGALCTDLRRLLGPSLWIDAPGAVLEVPLPHGHSAALLHGWSGRIAWMCAALGWRETALCQRRHATGTTLAFTAPPAALMSATALNEWALHATATELGVPFDPASLDDEALPLDQVEALASLHERIAAEAAAPPSDAAPIADRAIPIALVTGSNGKTTTTRLLAAMLRAHGHVVGMTSTEGVVIDTAYVERGDWSGPGGARRVLEDPTVTAAVLETARGGLLRRGLVVSRADVAVVTNIAEDHFGEYGIHSVADLTELKTSVAHALRGGGTLVLNGDDPLLDPARSTARLGAPARALPPARRVTFSLESPWPEWLPPIPEIPITFGGTARYNAANVLAAATAARVLGVPEALIAHTVRTFGNDPADNAGRLMRFALGGLTVLVDYAHNPHGLGALLETASAMTSGRMLLLLGQAGDRDDEAIRALARTAWRAAPALIVLKDLDGYMRGRAAGAVPAILEDELMRNGARPDQLFIVLDETDAVRTLLSQALPGDLVILPVHALAGREQVLELLAGLQVAGWSAGHPLPTLP